MKRLIFAAAALVLFASCSNPSSQYYALNDLEYFEVQGVNVLPYNNLFNGGFNDEKNSGLEIIHHGVRTIQGGAVRLNKTPEQWDLVPKAVSRTVDAENNSVEVVLRYEDYDFESRLVMTGVENGVEVSVYLDKPMPEFLVGKAGFNLEFIPSQYWNKIYTMDGRLNRFPRYAVTNTESVSNDQKPRQFKGYKTYDDRGTDCFVDPLPLETGHTILMAQDAPERMIKITSEDVDLELYDGRILAQNGWFVLRSTLPNETGKVLTWKIEPNAIKGWEREANIGFSQVGYMPSQPKVAVIEVDKVSKVQPTASIYRVNEDGSESLAYKGKTAEWGRWYKYNYVRFDFSSVTDPGVYYIQYGNTKTGNFIINDDVYDDITIATSDVWIPIHMNHMVVNEGYRIWHGEPFKEGYLQAPVNTDHFDLHSQGPTTDTPFKSLQHIPGLNVGGYFDAGDFDIETGSNIGVVNSLISAWERFQPLRDETFVSEEQRYVDLHRPDGTPDMLQYINHGVLNLLAQAEILGHMSQCLSNSVLDNYHHLGDAGSLTDGLIYDPSLKPYQISADGKRSGTPDDLWAFTSRNPWQDMNAANMFAAASRVLADYNPDVAKRCLVQSKKLFKEATDLMANMPADPRMQRRGMGSMGTSLQLYISTREQQYLDKFNEEVWNSLDERLEFSISTALQAVPYMDEAYREKLASYVEKYKEYIIGLEAENPYGLPIGTGNWAGSGGVVNFGTTVAYAAKYFPEIIDKSYALRAAEYLFGCHQYHNYSLVAAVGAARPKAVFYGNNRADFSFIPGNLAPGLLFRNPDHFENFDDWPFLWGQNEGTIAGNCGYLNFAYAVIELTR